VQNYAVRVSNCLARVPRSCDEIGGSSTIQAKDFHYKKSRFPNPGLPHPRILLVFTLCLVPFGYFRTNARVRVSSLSTRARGQGHLAGLDPVHGRFLRLENFLLQNCATQRSAAQISLVKTSSAKQTAQHREKLRKNSAFRKQVFSEFRGGVVEPELLPGSASSAADETVSALLRSRYGFGR
jgi:hypothetical protein